MKIVNKINGISISTGLGWRVAGDHVVEGSVNSVTHSLRDIAEIDKELAETDEDVKPLIDGMVYAGDLSADELKCIVLVYPEFVAGRDYIKNELLRLGTKLYRVEQPHKSQSDWTPDKVPALFVEIAPKGVIPDWKQPSGAHDAYKKGDRVLFNDSVYESKIDANVWSPTGYPAGWLKL